MAWESPRVQKALDASAARQRVRQAAAAAGPRLSDDLTSIIIPSPDYHSDLVKTLRVAGFHYKDLGDSPYWWRSTAKLHLGKVWLPAAWLAWARRHYAAAWVSEQRCEGYCTAGIIKTPPVAGGKKVTGWDPREPQREFFLCLPCSRRFAAIMTAKEESDRRVHEAKKIYLRERDEIARRWKEESQQQ